MSVCAPASLGEIVARVRPKHYSVVMPVVEHAMVTGPRLLQMNASIHVVMGTNARAKCSSANWARIDCAPRDGLPTLGVLLEAPVGDPACDRAARVPSLNIYFHNQSA